MPDVKMLLIPEPTDPNASVIIPTTSAPAFRSTGDQNLMCAKCGALLAEHIGKGQLNNIVIKCYACKSFNLTPRL